MPKQAYVINKFHGGVSSNPDPRDINESESPDICASTDNIGKLTTIGDFDKGSDDNNSTSTITGHKSGLYVMPSDRKVSSEAESDEDLIFHYDYGTEIDVKDSGGWTTGEITVASNTQPTYFSADGVLRVGDANLNSSSTMRWYGHISRTVFSSLGCSETIADWIEASTSLTKPGGGNCLISTPSRASDSTGPNSNKSEYKGAIGSSLIATNQLNLRVGIADAVSVKTDGTGITASNLTLSPSDASNNKHDYREYSGGSSGVYDNAKDIYPLLFNNNILIGGEHSENTVNGATNEAYADGITNLNFTINEKKSIAIGIYFWEDSSANAGGFEFIDFVTIRLGTGSSDYREWQIPSSKMDSGWNVIVCEQGRHTSESGTPPLYGESHDYFSIKATQADTSTNASTDIPCFYISGPAIINNVGSVGYTEGTYYFNYTWLYDDEKQESLVKKMNDTDDSDGHAKELNKITIVGAPLLFNFDIYINPKVSSYGLNKRIVGSRIYYKKKDDDSHYLVGECNFVDKGFKFFPESETYDYDFADVDDTTSNLANAVLIKGITPESANVVDTYKSLNGFYQKVDTLYALFKSGTIQGRRAYVGNVRQNGVSYPDRMLKSMVNKFDTFPDKESIVDVAVRDGENIVKLESFADRILQFKERTLYVINVAQNAEFLENVFSHKGIEKEYHSTKTDKGVAFFNSNGIYLYNGNSVLNLLEKNGISLINENTWKAFVEDGGIQFASIVSVPKKHQLIISNKYSSLYIYSFITKSWIHRPRGLGDVIAPDIRETTREVIDGNNDVFFIGGNTSTIFKYDAEPTDQTSFLYKTKDIDFGNPSVRKKIYKVYITYKTGNSNYVPNITCAYDINGAGTYNKAFKTDENYYAYPTGDSLTPSENWKTISLKPNVSSEANNIYSFSLKLEVGTIINQTAQATSPNSATILLHSGASGTDDFYNNLLLTVYSGNGAGQTVRITDYDAITADELYTKYATVNPAFTSPVPNGSSKFVLGVVPKEFEVNDITIIYRVKSIK
tara:strand:+ start:845 stop:3904 length:3060 start_codon:yes stop_codon:yes gene_type:complete